MIVGVVARRWGKNGETLNSKPCIRSILDRSRIISVKMASCKTRKLVSLEDRSRTRARISRYNLTFSTQEEPIVKEYAMMMSNVGQGVVSPFLLLKKTNDDNPAKPCVSHNAKSPLSQQQQPIAPTTAATRKRSNKIVFMDEKKRLRVLTSSPEDQSGTTGIGWHLSDIWIPNTH